MLQHIKCFPVSAMEWKKGEGGWLEEFLFHNDWPFSLWPSVFSWWKAPLLVSWHSLACLCACGTFNLASDTCWSVTLPNKWGFVQTKRLPDRNCKLGAWYAEGNPGYGWVGTGNSLQCSRARGGHTPVHTCVLSDLPRPPAFRQGRIQSTAAFVPGKNATGFHYRPKLTLHNHGIYLWRGFIL